MTIVVLRAHYVCICNPISIDCNHTILFIELDLALNYLTYAFEIKYLNAMPLVLSNFTPINLYKRWMPKGCSLCVKVFWLHTTLYRVGLLVLATLKDVAQSSNLDAISLIPCDQIVVKQAAAIFNQDSTLSFDLSNLITFNDYSFNIAVIAKNIRKKNRMPLIFKNVILCYFNTFDLQPFHDNLILEASINLIVTNLNEYV